MDLSTLPQYVPGFSQDLNLHELGGLPTTDGRHVRHGLLYRGSALVGLTPAEIARIDELGLRFILDLRSDGEEQMMGVDYVPQGAEHIREGGMRYKDGSEVDFSPAGMLRFEQETGIAMGGAPDMDFFLNLYVSMLYGNQATHELWNRFEAHEAPLYFHCTAGKDRTGMCALVLGLALGVEREALVADYLITNEYRKYVIQRAIDDLGADAPEAEKERIRVTYGVTEDTLRDVLACIDADYPSPEAYITTEFAVSEDELAALRDFYLE